MKDLTPFDERVLRILHDTPYLNVTTIRTVLQTQEQTAGWPKSAGSFLMKLWRISEFYTGTLDVSLARLEQRQLIASGWAPWPAKPPRHRMYWLTDTGTQYVQAMTRKPD